MNARMASAIFAIASSSVAPCDQHPGRPGAETLKPSSSRRNTILYLIRTSDLESNAASGSRLTQNALRAQFSSPQGGASRRRPVGPRFMRAGPFPAVQPYIQNPHRPVTTT